MKRAAINFQSPYWAAPARTQCSIFPTNRCDHQLQCPRTVMVKRDNRGCCKISCKRKSMILVAMPHHQRNSRPHLESIVKYGDGRHFQPVLFSPEPCSLSKRPRADINVSFHLSTVEHSNAKANVHFHFCPSGNGRQGNKTFFTRCVLHV